MNPSRPTVFQAGSPGLLPLSALLVLVCLLAAPAHAADDFETFLKPLWAQHCLKCHGEDKVKGKVNLKEILSVDQFLKQPGLIKEMVEVIDAYDMPPEEEPKLDENDRARLLATLKQLLRDATGNASRQQVRIRRLNRFQYNNAIRDLFQLNRDVFRLPEKMMTRRTAYLHPPAATLPDSVEATCGSLNKDGGLREVNPFPKDLRAAHGFDNQANQLTLSPLLLDTFLKLSVSIMESPDFNADTVGVWNEFFMAPPADADMAAEVSARLKPFLSKAFRRSIDEGTLDRYATYTLRKIEEGLSFAESMKKVSSATLVSPLFLYRYTAADNGESPYNLAANLSFFLWGSGPDEALLERAESGELATPETLDATIDRMLADPKIERFLDTFPAQWMQLENILAATPDPARHRLFSLDKNNPASMHMVLEPLLLFDAVFLEDRPVIELVSPTFGYQSKFLQDWYNTPLKPEPIDEAAVAAENKARGDKRKSLETGLQKIRAELAELDKALADPIATKWTDVDLTPGQTQWETAQARRVADSVVLSTWHRLGPFGAESLPKAHRKPFINETDVDLTAVHGDQKWTAAEAYVDGKVHTLEGANCATYLYRTLEAGTARPLELSLGSDDSFKIWLNGRKVAERQVTRGVAPDQDKVKLDLVAGENTLLMKVCNGGGGYGFYFKANTIPLPGPVIAALKVEPGKRTDQQKAALRDYYLGFAPELESVRMKIAAKKEEVTQSLRKWEADLNQAPKPQDLASHRQEAQRRFDEDLRNKLRSPTFTRVPASDPRYGGVITSAAMLSMTSGPNRTHPIARGAWIIEVIFNDPPPPPPNDVPPLNEEDGDENLTIREKFARHRENPDCAGCHSRLDPLGFALENFDITGRWRDVYENGRDVDASGVLMKRHPFKGIVDFKESLVKEQRRFAKAFTAHLLRFALARELSPADSLTVDRIVDKTARDNYKLRSLIREVIHSDSFLHSH